MNNQVYNPGNRRQLVIIFIAVLLGLAACKEDDTAPSPSVAVRDGTAARPTIKPTLPPTNTPRDRSAPTAALTSTTRPTPEETPQATELPPTAEITEGCESPGEVETVLFPSEVAGPERGFRIYLPPCYGEDGRTYPTLYLFHGGAHSEDHWDNLGIDEAAEAAIKAQLIPPIIIVMPDGGELANNSSGGSRSFEGVVVDELIPYVETHYCAWPEPSGRALGGISRGGYWALEIAFRHPEEFSSVGGHSAALLDTAAGPDLNPQYTALSNDLGALRIYLDIGDGDWVIENIQRLHLEMDLAGIRHTWVLNEGQHEDAYWSAHLDDYLEWYAEPWPEERESYPSCQATP